MKNGDIYTHYKGNDYKFIRIALPMKDDLLDTKELVKFSTVRYHENNKDFDVYTATNGSIFIDSDVPFVIYKSLVDYKIWAREVDDFFTYINKNGSFIKRFKLKKEN